MRPIVAADGGIVPASSVGRLSPCPPCPPTTPPTLTSEVLVPDAILATTGVGGGVVVGDINDNALTSVDVTWAVDDGTGLLAGAAYTNYQIRVSFPTPAQPLAIGVGLQRFLIRVRKQPGVANSPDMRVVILESGVEVATLATGIVVLNSTTQYIEVAWDAAILGTVSGANVEVRVDSQRSAGSVGNRSIGQVGAIRWTATSSQPAP